MLFLYKKIIVSLGYFLEPNLTVYVNVLNFFVKTMRLSVVTQFIFKFSR